MVLTVQQKPVTSGAAPIVATTIPTATTTSGLQVGVTAGTAAAAITTTMTSTTITNTTVTATANQQHQRPVSLSAAGNVSLSQPATSLHRASTAPAAGVSCNARITGPQPVDVNKNAYIKYSEKECFFIT